MAWEKNNKLLILGVIIVLLLFSYMEFLHPYNFSKDDNLVQFLPVLIEGSNQLFSGHLPSINLHQYMGSKILEVGTYAILYPPTIISYFFSNYIFDNNFLLIEIFILIHLIAGFIITYYFIKSKVKNELISLLSSLAFTFSGYVIIMSAAWYYVAPTIVFLPLILFLNDKIIFNKKYIFLIGILRGIYFYSGNAQYFAYVLFFEALYMIINLYQNDWKNVSEIIKRYVLSIIITILIALPLLLAQIDNIGDASRGNLIFLEYLFSQPSSLNDILFGALFQYPLVKASSVLAHAPSSFIDIYYSGTIFSLLFFLGGLLVFKYGKYSLKRISAFFWLGILSIILSLGIYGLIYIIGVFIPLINSFRQPIKFTLFINFFTIMFGAVIMDRFFLKEKKNFKKNELKKISKLLLFLILATFMILFFLHITLSTKVSLTYYGDRLPLDLSEFDHLNLSGRIISIYTNSTYDPRLAHKSTYEDNFEEAPFLSENFATYYGLDHISGREPFQDELTEEKIPISQFGLSGVNLNFTSLKEYGVKYIFIPKDSLKYHPEIKNLNLLHSTDIRNIYEIGDVKGLIFTEDGDLPYNRSQNGFTFETNFAKPNNVIINLLYKDNYVYELNGKISPISKDDFGRMIIKVPEGQNYIKIYYSPKNFILGFWIALLLIPLFTFVFQKTIDYKFNIKASKKKVLFFVIVIFLLIIFLNAFYYLTNSFVFENAIKQKIGLDANIGKLSINPLSGRIILANTSLLDNQKENFFYADKITLKVDFFESFKRSFTTKKTSIIIDESLFENVKINVSMKAYLDNECGNIIYDEISNNLKHEGGVFTLFSQNVALEKMEIISLNTFIVSINESFFLINPYGNLILPSINLKIIKESDPKYLRGIITIDRIYEGQEKPVCVFLPKESKNLIYY